MYNLKSKHLEDIDTQLFINNSIRNIHNNMIKDNKKTVLLKYHTLNKEIIMKGRKLNRLYTA